MRNTEIIVNKQDGQIQLLNSDMYDEDGIVNRKYTEISQSLDEIVASVQNSGGNNLIKNSVMFAHDNEGKPNDWETAGDGTITIGSNAESLLNGCASGHSFTLRDKIARQRVPVKVSTADDSSHYTFSTKVKKNAIGTCYIKIYNDSEEYVIDIPTGESAFYKDYEIKELEPKEPYYIIEFYGSAESDATFTDNMLIVGKYKSRWTQANGEVMNTQVNINTDGVLVKSSVYLGDYTVMSPLEFAGYSNVNGTMTKVFSLNKDVTDVEKLTARKEVKMAPLKVIPITEGEMQGWAFVLSK